MSLSINNYLNSTFQDVRTTSAEKLGQKDKAAETGKTQESAVSASLDQINMGEDGIAVTEVSRQQGAEQSAAKKYSATPHMDTVEISKEGKAKAASAISRAKQTESDAAEEYQSEAENLSKYTDTELKQMYYRGEITRQEYENETGRALE